jgi:HK97 family phage major capsid protein
MFKNRKAQVEKLNDKITRAESLVNTAEIEKRELTDDEAQELAEIRDDIQRIKKYLDIVDEIDEARPGEVVEKEKEAENVIDGKDERACGEDKSRAEQEERAFANYIRGVVSHERDGELAPANNGAIVPVTIAKRIVELVYDICPILEKSEKYNVKGKLEIPYYPADSSTQITVAYATEFEDLTSSTGNFTSIELSGFLAGALTKISKSLINNTDIEIVGFVVKRMAYDIARFIEKELLIGTKGNGTTTQDKVLGLSTATNITELDSTSIITSDDLVTFQGTIKDIYQANAMWIMSPKTRDALRLLKDDVGRYLLNDDITSPFGKVLLGKPVYVSDNMPDIGATNKVIYYGDMSGLATKFSEEVHIEVLRELYAAQHAIGVVGWVEFDGKVQDQQKIAVLKMADS